jgi:hypothetical protein
MTTNKRQFPRREIRIETELHFHDENSRTVITHDMSEGGMFLQLKNTGHYTMGEMVRVRFKNPFLDFEETEKDAVIVRHADNGIGIAFVEIDM